MSVTLISSRALSSSNVYPSSVGLVTRKKRVKMAWISAGDASEGVGSSVSVSHSIHTGKGI